MINVKRLRGGVHPDPHKRVQDSATVTLPLPEIVTIPLFHQYGAVCEVLVKRGDHVNVGQKIGEVCDRQSVPVYSSVSGTVSAVGPMPHAIGSRSDAVTIETDGLQTIDPSVQPPAVNSKQDMIEAIRQSGLVGLGGAGFPSWYKLTPPAGDTLDTLIVNGAECEPYISSDYREMVENPEGIIAGIKIVLDLTDASRALIGIEDNKPEAIEKIKAAAASDSRIEVAALKTQYPQGGERQLIHTLTGRKVGMRKLPSTVGCLVMNVATLSYIDTYIRTGMPLVERRITVAGDCIVNPQNVIVPVGTRLEELVKFCGGFSKDPDKVIMGGPMMGVSQFDLNNSILKQSNAVLALSHEEANTREESVCIRCGKCVASCPMILMPNELNEQILLGNVETARDKYHLYDCIECGCCDYVCPAARHLVQSFRFGKAELNLLEKQAALAEGQAAKGEN